MTDNLVSYLAAGLLFAGATGIILTTFDPLYAEVFVFPARIVAFAFVAAGIRVAVGKDV